MALAIRSAVAFAVLLLASGAVFAQPAVAPEPHLAIDELVREYKRWGMPAPSPEDAKRPTTGTEVRAAAWYFWNDQLSKRHSDRKAAYTHLSALAPEFVTWRDETLLIDLKATLAPRKSKPGSVEALIDDLTEHWDDPEDRENEAGQGAYWKLVELGLDAVPALIEHLNDVRLTRTTLRDWKTGWPIGKMRVGYLVEWMLTRLSAGRFEQEAYPRTAAEGTVAPKDHKWLEMVRCGGEEAWLLDNVLPKDNEGGPFPNEIILRVIRAKYPQRLKDVYQTLLHKYPHVYSDQVTKAIVASKLPLKAKIAILEIGVGAVSKEHDIGHLHWSNALEAIAGLDAAVFRKHLLHFLEGLPPTLMFRPDAFNNELTVLSLIRKTEDQRCWDVLAELSKRVSPTTRLHFVRMVSWPAEGNEPNPNRACIRYLLGFRDDTATGDEFWKEAPVVRDFTTLRLALVLGIATSKEAEQLRSPREISLLRAQVRELAERELARPAK